MSHRAQQAKNKVDKLAADIEERVNEPKMFVGSTTIVAGTDGGVMVKKGESKSNLHSPNGSNYTTISGLRKN